MAVVVVDDIGDHHGHVVRAAAAQRQLDEAVGGFGHVRDLQGFQDGLVADRVAESVGAEQVAVAGPRLAHGQRGFDLVTGQRAHDQRPLRVAVRLFAGDAALVDEGLDEGVVLGDLRQFTVTQQIAARIADVYQANSVAREQDRGERGAHSLEFGLRLHLRRDGCIAGAHRGVELGQQVAAGFVVVEVGQRGDHQLGGDLARGVAAHAVGQGEQPGTGVYGVFVVGAHQAAIAARGVSQDQGHGRNSSIPASPASSS
ncbi:hypothetical protein A9X04_05275 [Mycobacterium sp. E3247]|nr:hypothetical protein A9X04_05275 [Mycobacterium sp. E3247]